MKPTKAVEVWEVLPTNRFPLQVDCARKETRSVSSSALAVAATQAMHYEPGLGKPFRLWSMHGGSPGRVVFLLIFGQFCTAAPADSSAVVPWKIGMCANQVAGSLPSGLGVCAHTLTDSKIVSIPDTLIKPLKHLFVTNCPSDLASALHDRHVGVWAEWRQQKRLYCKFIDIAIWTCAINKYRCICFQHLFVNCLLPSVLIVRRQAHAKGVPLSHSAQSFSAARL